MDIRDHIGEWDYSTLPANVQIGEHCFLEERGSFARFRSRRSPGLVIGSRVKAYNWTTFSVEPTGYLEIGDDAILTGPVFWCAHHIVVGRRVSISYNVMIADSDFHPRELALRRIDAHAISPSGDVANRPEIECRPVIIEDDVQIGIGAIVLKGVRIGVGARVMPGAVVTRSVPAGATVQGNPGQVLAREAAGGD
jgi:acetyltransferase-like isoleucine patch superfamily enzyme